MLKNVFSAVPSIQGNLNAGNSMSTFTHFALRVPEPSKFVPAPGNGSTGHSLYGWECPTDLAVLCTRLAERHEIFSVVLPNPEHTLWVDPATLVLTLDYPFALQRSFSITLRQFLEVSGIPCDNHDVVLGALQRYYPEIDLKDRDILDSILDKDAPENIRDAYYKGRYRRYDSPEARAHHLIRSLLPQLEKLPSDSVPGVLELGDPTWTRDKYQRREGMMDFDESPHVKADRLETLSALQFWFVMRNIYITVRLGPASPCIGAPNLVIPADPGLELTSGPQGLESSQPPCEDAETDD